MESSDNNANNTNGGVGDESNGDMVVHSGLAEALAKMKLGGFPGFTNGGVGLPAEVERRIKALKKLQVDMFKTECKFFEELHDLEAKYASMYAKNWCKRGEIILGKHEPNDDECDFKIADVEEEEKKDEGTEEKKSDTEAPVKGIPHFWLTIFQNVEQFSDMIESCDVPILEHLEDITMEMMKEPMGFTLFFHFSPNEYFSNPVLTKTYEMRVHIDPKDPFSFEGTEIHKSTGCKIDWKEGKDVTVREVKKKQKHKNTGAIRLSTKQVANDSFFGFFNPPQIDENEDAEVDTDLQEKVTVDFELGSFLKERLLPRAVLYFTGEALESDDEEEEEDDEDYSDDETEGEEEEEGDASHDDADDDAPLIIEQLEQQAN